MFGFRNRIRAYLGTDTLHRIEEVMANEILTLLQGLASQTTELTATQQASFTNIHGALTRQEAAIRDLTERLNAAVEGNGRVTPEMQDAATQISTALADLKKAAETADNGYEPVEEPTDDEPVDVPPTDVPADQDLPVEVPGDETPTENTARRR